MKFTRQWLTKFLTGAYRTLTDVRMENLEAMPKEGPLILVMNHMSRIDFPLFFSNGRREDWSIFVADSYKKWPIFSKAVDDADLVWIDRTKADFTAMKKAFDWLKKGGLFVLSPEGTRSKTGKLLQAKTGIGLLASKSGVPVCTGSITGTENFMQELLHFRKPKISVYFAPPVKLNPIDPDRREESLREETDELMCRIASMLPEKYRGHYKDFPRVQELIEEWKNHPELKLPDGV